MGSRDATESPVYCGSRKMSLIQEDFEQDYPRQETCSVELHHDEAECREVQDAARSTSSRAIRR